MPSAGRDARVVDDVRGKEKHLQVSQPLEVYQASIAGWLVRLLGLATGLLLNLLALPTPYDQ